MQLKQKEPAPVDDNGKDRVRLKGHKLSLTCICIDSKDKHVFTGSKDGSIIKWDLETRKILNKETEVIKKRIVNCLALSSDDKFLASGCSDKHIRIHSPEDLSLIHTFSLHKQQITALSFRKGHHTLYSASADRSVMIWTLEDDDNRCFVEALYGHESPITCLDSLKKERLLSSGGRDQTIRIWKIVDQAQTVFECEHESVDVVKYIDDKTFVSGGEDGSITVWTTLKRNPVCSVKNAHQMQKKPEGLSLWISALAVHNCSETVTGKKTKKRKLDDEDGDELVTRLDDQDEVSDQDEHEGDEGAITTAVAYIASGSCSSEVRVWKLMKKGSTYSLELHQTVPCIGFVNDLRFTSDGKRLLASCGKEHRSGRWWRLIDAKNCMRILDLNNKSDR